MDVASFFFFFFKYNSKGDTIVWMLHLFWLVLISFVIWISDSESHINKKKQSKSLLCAFSS